MQSIGLFKALGSQPRMKILQELLERGSYTCYCELDEVLDKDLSVIYRHFKKLEETGLIKVRKNGKKVEGRTVEPEKVKKLFKLVEELIDED